MVKDPDETQDTRADHISVCICTYRRPEMLARGLEAIIAQVTHAAFTMEVVITDNDKSRSAEKVVREFQKSGKCRVIYDCEPEQSIALARNRTVRNATGDFIATIDDDEFPADDWLYRMYACLRGSHADGALGPVLPHFPDGAPNWLKKSGLCERPRHASGSAVGSRDLRTGNALFRRHVFGRDEIWFDPSRGQGGEDGDFLSRQINRGRKFVWCDEAIVHETVSEDRWPAKYYTKRNFMIGAMVGEYYRRRHILRAPGTSGLLFLGYSAVMPFSFFRGKHVWMKIVTKMSYHGGCVLSFLHLTRVPRRQ